MFSQIRHSGGRRLLLLAALLAGASWSGLAQAQASDAAVAQAEVEVAQAELALAKARLKLIKAGASGQAAPAAPTVPKTAEAATEPKTTPPLDEGGDSDVETTPDEGAKSEEKGTAKAAKAPAATAAETKGRAEFGGLEFGVGISFTLDVGSNDRITEAELVNGLVRVKDEDNGRARIMLESHYFFKPAWAPFGVTPGDFGWGPFIALQPGTDNIIEAVAIGGMIGFRRPGEGTESFNLGLGVVIDPNTRILGDDILANQPLPIGETAIRYKEKMQTGLLLLASFGF